MSVASKNPFQLLGDDGDDSPTSVAAKAPVKAPAPQPARNIPGAGQKSAPRASQTPRGGARGGNRAAVDPAADGEPKDSRGGRPRGEGRGRGRGRGGRGRAFDRHSQTDRIDTQKNLHQGWGGDDGKRELDVEKKAEADAKAEGTEANGAPAAADSEPAAPEPEEEDKTLTLDEYLAAQAEKRANLGAPKPRDTKTDDSAWSNFGVKFEKDASSEDYFAAKKTEKTRIRAQKEGKQLLEIEQRFDPPPSFRGRGSRGGPRGGRGGDRGSTRGGPRGGRGGRGNNANVNLADHSAFPELS